MPDIFISYAKEDRTRIALLVKALEALGWSVFWDRTIPTGKAWHQVIGEALKNARAVIVAWSHHSIESEWVYQEADRGRKRNILLPILIDDVDPPLGFGALQAANLTNWSPTEDSSEFNKLVIDIRRILSSSPEHKRKTPPVEPGQLKQEQEGPLPDKLSKIVNAIEEGQRKQEQKEEQLPPLDKSGKREEPPGAVDTAEQERERKQAVEEAARASRQQIRREIWKILRLLVLGVAIAFAAQQCPRKEPREGWVPPTTIPPLQGKKQQISQELTAAGIKPAVIRDTGDQAQGYLVVLGSYKKAEDALRYLQIFRNSISNEVKLYYATNEYYAVTFGSFKPKDYATRIMNTVRAQRPDAYIYSSSAFPYEIILSGF